MYREKERERERERVNILLQAPKGGLTAGTVVTIRAAEAYYTIRYDSIISYAIL